MTTLMFDGAPLVDAQKQPDQARLAAIWKAGYRVAGGYLGGPSLYLPDLWHGPDFAAARAQGFSIVAFWVGYSGGAVEAAGLAGLQHEDVLCLDVEGGAPATNAQQVQFSNDARAAGYRSGLYGSVATTNANWRSFDCIIAANYTGSSTPPGSSAAPGSSAGCPQGWQWRGTFTEPFSGSTIDATVADDWFVGAQPDMGQMNIDVARSIVFVRLSGEGILRSQAQIDAYAGPMADPAQSAEQWLTNLNADIAKDAGSLSNRVAKLEAAAGTPSAPDDDTALSLRVTSLEAKAAAVKAAL